MQNENIFQPSIIMDHNVVAVFVCVLLIMAVNNYCENLNENHQINKNDQIV